MSYPHGFGQTSQNPGSGQPQPYYPGQNPANIGYGQTSQHPRSGHPLPFYPGQNPPNVGAYPPHQVGASAYPTQHVGGIAPSPYPATSGGFPAMHQVGASAYPQPNVGGIAPSQYGAASGGFPAVPNPDGFPHQGQQQYSSPNPSFSHQAQQQYPSVATGLKLSPTVKPADRFDASADAAVLRKAMKGFGTNEQALIDVLCNRSNAQVQQIKLTFKTSFGKDLVKDVKSETSGRFEDVLVALLTPRLEYQAQELKNAVAGVGTDEDALIELLCSLNNTEMQLISREYHRLYNKSLEKDVKSDTSGHFQRLLVSLCTANRDESGRVDPEKARQDALALREAGINKIGTDESVFNEIICQRNYAQLRLICDEYVRLTGQTLVQSINAEFSGYIKIALKSVVRCATNRPEFFAKCLYNSMVGLGTNDAQLIRVLVTRCEIDLADVKVAFQQKFGKSLRSFIQGDTSGYYKIALLHLIGEK